MTDESEVVTRIDSFTGDYAFLSNFSHARIEYNGITYQTVEHAYQAQKTTNRLEQESFSKLRTASGAKLAGRRVPMSDGRRKWWDDNKLDIMAELLQLKFDIPRLRDLLVATGEAELVEGNIFHERFWGSCICGQRPSNASELTRLVWEKGCSGGGENFLGRLLMAVRETIR